MAVPATYGSGVFGATAETGVLISDVAMELTTEQAFSKNHVGVDQGVTIYNEQGTLTLSYFMVTADTHITNLSLGTGVAAANDGIIHTPGSTTNELAVISQSSQRPGTGYQTGTTTMMYRAGIDTL